MEKTRIDLEILLPEVPGERDECVTKIIHALQSRRGIELVHLVPQKDNSHAQLCFHYDASVISVTEVEDLAKAAGAELTVRYGHLLFNVSGIRHPRHARIIERELRAVTGIVSVAVAATGFIQLEYERAKTSQETIERSIRKAGLDIKNVEDFHQTGKEDHAEHAHGDHEHAHEEHGHSHGGIFGEKTELIFALISGALLGIGFGLSFINGLPEFIPIAFYIGAYFFGGYFTTKEALTAISKGDFEIDFLMLVAAIGAAVLGEWAEGALLLFLFSMGHALEHYAMEKARKSIAALADLAPKTALLKQDGTLKEVDIANLKPGDIIVVKPNSKISADGIVIKGNSSVNQAPITGESIPVDKIPVDNPDIDIATANTIDKSHKVFAGSINGAEALEIKVSKVASDSTIARLVKLVNEAQTQKSRTQNFTDKLEKYYVPAVLILVVLLLGAFLVVDEPFSASFYRAMAVLVAASPCALAISTPSAVLSGVARAARCGVLIKGGKPLEELGTLTAIAFDKTGTLTEGKPKLTGAYPLNGFSEGQLLEIAIAVEKLSDHPLAAAIVKGASEKVRKEIKPAEKAEAIVGRGVKAVYNGSVVHIGNKDLFIEKGSSLPDDVRKQAEDLEQKGNTTMIVELGDKLMGILTLMDTPRPDAKPTLSQLQTLGVKRMVMLTGDNQKVAEAIAKEIGITDAMGNLLPEQKVAAIDKLRVNEKQVAMVGDGVNDAPAMAKSTVGIAMGAAGSDVALETADIALMADKLSNLPFAIGLSKKASRIIKQNLVVSLGMVAILIPLTILGIAHIGPAVIGHEGSTLVVVFNALRLLGYRAPQGNK
ncbi:heavy metal translocating P-type ATPase [Polluticoccus soli]|uniref:heavy metal translocating P-type ATPase n=1 Tax=Polluticoccus soli TaxID=3034150 RepID=UPI0023E143CD|nr:heavy metal translocating P-type ATPase [Flavipsychrobacter sp. JY13-12]